MQSVHHPVMPAVAAFDNAPGANDTSGTSGSNGSGGSNITANDFLELLVAEMKNQDPTANTDPNAYIDQLVQVNSLQQLIQINQNLNGSGSASDSGSGSSSDASRNAAPHAISAASRLATSLVDNQAQSPIVHGDFSTHDSKAGSHMPLFKTVISHS